MKSRLKIGGKTSKTTIITLCSILIYLFSPISTIKALAQGCLNDDGVCPENCQPQQDNDCLIRGKGILYYSENTRTPFSIDNLPVPLAEKQAFESLMIKGVDCTRYFDLTQREVDYFKDLGVDFVIIGYGPASWYNLAPTKPTNPRDFNDPAYNFAVLDRWLSLLQRNNLKTVFVGWGTPTWSSKLEIPLPTADLDTAYPVPPIGTISPLKGNRYWYLPNVGAKWQTNTLESAYNHDGDNFETINPPVPVEDIDTAYFDPWEGNLSDQIYGYSIIKGNRYWHRASGTASGNWYTNTLESAYNLPGDNFETINPPVPVENIDVAYYDLYGAYKKGSYTIIKGDRYWFREGGRSGNWYTNTLESAYNLPGDNFETINPPVPTKDIDAAYFDPSGAYVLIKGDNYWRRSGGTSGNWETGKLYSLYGFSDEWEANCEMANPFREFSRYSFSPADLNDFGNFMYAVASRYNGKNIPLQGESGFIKVDTFCLWNEPNYSTTWQVPTRESDGKIKCKKQENGICVFDRVNNSVENVVKTFVTFQNYAYDQIKLVQPNAIIWSPHLVLGYDTGSSSKIKPTDFLNYSLTGNPKLKFDVFAFHPYWWEEPKAVQGSGIYNMFNLPNLIDYVNQLYCPLGQTCVDKFAVSEFGKRSMIENVFGNDYRLTTEITIDGITAANHLKQEIEKVNKDNLGYNGEKYRNMIIAVTNNTLYDPWIWWDTGLINYYTWKETDFNNLGMNWENYVESISGDNFTQKNKKYQIFKNWISLFFRDFKILLKNYSAAPLEEIKRVDFNKDGKINAVDFSKLLTQGRN